MFTESALDKLCDPFDANVPERELTRVAIPQKIIVGKYWIWTNHPNPGDHLIKQVDPPRRARALGRGRQHWVFELAFTHNGFYLIVRWVELITADQEVL